MSFSISQFLDFKDEDILSLYKEMQKINVSDENIEPAELKDKINLVQIQ
jgi:hypothetical protein